MLEMNDTPSRRTCKVRMSTRENRAYERGQKVGWNLLYLFLFVM